jgi:hypothetical protein
MMEEEGVLVGGLQCAVGINGRVWGDAGDILKRSSLQGLYGRGGGCRRMRFNHSFVDYLSSLDFADVNLSSVQALHWISPSEARDSLGIWTFEISPFRELVRMGIPSMYARFPHSS